MKKRLLPFVVLPLLLLNSCLGLSMDIDMRSNGSGRITLVYQVSNMAEAIGRLDGNERWPTIPVGRADWERTVERSPGLSLVSFSRREERQNTVYNVRLAFENPAALERFLDPAGRNALFISTPDFHNFYLNIIGLTFSEIDPALLDLARQVSAGYKFEMSFRAPSDVTMTFDDAFTHEMSAPQAVRTNVQGRKASLSIDIADLLSLTYGLGVKFTYLNR
jgi:hypothetical protein